MPLLQVWLNQVKQKVAEEINKNQPSTSKMYASSVSINSRKEIVKNTGGFYHLKLEKYSLLNNFFTQNFRI